LLHKKIKAVIVNDSFVIILAVIHKQPFYFDGVYTGCHKYIPIELRDEGQLKVRTTLLDRVNEKNRRYNG
jgi:hypothetical protein